MALKSTTFKAKANPKTVDTKKARLEGRHKSEIDKVVSDARNLADDRRQALSGISSFALRTSATR